jgi:hypothetical protein
MDASAYPEPKPARLPEQWLAESDFGPRTLTILPTYRCTAACEQCCFGSNPDAPDGLSLARILRLLDDAVAAFPRLQLVVFSGGECFLLGQDFFAAIAQARHHGLLVRAVSNGFWGKSPRAAMRIAKRAKAAGLSELNLSTGRDHVRWVPLTSVVHAAAASVNAGISTLLTVEEDADDSEVVSDVLANPVLQALQSGGSLFKLVVNTWMRFNDRHAPRVAKGRRASIDMRCNQLFDNLVVTPHGNAAACCGLPFEYIPELRLGSIDELGLADLYRSQYDDFLKWWIHAEGPLAVVRAVAPERAEALERCDHICEACAALHRDVDIRRALRVNFERHVPRVLSVARIRPKFLSSPAEFVLVPQALGVRSGFRILSTVGSA